MGVRNLKVLFLSIDDPTNKKSWSGTSYYILNSILPHFNSTKIAVPFHKAIKLYIPKIKSKLEYLVTGKRFDYGHSKELAMIYKEHFEKQIQNSDADLVISVVASTAMAYIETDKPFIHISDATFAKMINYYPDYTNLTRQSIKEGNEIEYLALSKSLINVFSSEWARTSAIEDYNISADKNYCIPFGANLDEDPHIDWNTKHISNNINLLFLGVDWIRKGGDIALNTYNYLKEKCIPVTLYVCGCKIPYYAKDPNVINIPFLNKNNPEEYRKLIEILNSTHFLIMPTKAECYGIVFCEASAFGIPSLTYATGGVPSAVNHHVNGILLHPNATHVEYANQILYYVNHPKDYLQLCKSAREKYERQLNWNKWTLSFIEILEKYL
jgi:glycosyltransferase involved in cell wall biosynthesis